MFFIVKLVVSATIIAVVTEISRRLPSVGGMIAALPLVSLLSIMWLSLQGETKESVQLFTGGVLAGLPATAFLLFIVYVTTKHSFPLPLSLGCGFIGWFLFIGAQHGVTQWVTLFGR